MHCHQRATFGQHLSDFLQCTIWLVFYNCGKAFAFLDCEGFGHMSAGEWFQLAGFFEVTNPPDNSGSVKTRNISKLLLSTLA